MLFLETMVMMAVFCIVVAIIFSGNSVTAATTRHQQYAFVARRFTSRQQWQHHSSSSLSPQAATQRRVRRTTKLAANGGMDAYDAQMAAMMSSSSSTRQPAMITTDEQNNNFSNEETKYASENSSSKWSGQNSYTQQLFLQPPSSYSASSSYTTTTSSTTPVGVDAYAAEMELTSRASFAQEQNEQLQSTEEGSVMCEEDDDPYEMQFANYLQNLQDEMEIEDVNEDGSLSSSSVVNNNNNEGGVEYIHVNEEEFTIDEQSSSDQEDAFLRMVSNEVQYKKLLNQSPYALTDIEWSTIIQRFLDNLEDGTQKQNGKIKGMSKLRRKDKPKEDRKTVVVVSFVLFVCVFCVIGEHVL